MTSPTVNAYFNPPGNEIVFPAGIMQMPSFSADLPEYVSYGGFGATGKNMDMKINNTKTHC
jgi:endothelin-converting enzyme